MELMKDDKISKLNNMESNEHSIDTKTYEVL